MIIVLSGAAIWHLRQSWIVIAILLLDTDSDMNQVVTQKSCDALKLQQLLLNHEFTAGQKWSLARRELRPRIVWCGCDPGIQCWATGSAQATKW